MKFLIDLMELPFLNVDGNRTFLSSTVEDATSEEIMIPGGFPFGNGTLTSIFVSITSYILPIQHLLNIVFTQVSTNGLLSFNRSFQSHTPHFFPLANYLVAPFWADIDITNGVGEVSYEVNDDSQSESLSWVSTYISQQQQINFTGTWMLLAKWKDVPKYLGDTSDVS